MSENNHLRVTEYSDVEKPFLDELRSLGWTVIDGEEAGTKFYPEASMRESFSETIIERELDDALFRINPWLERTQLSDAKRPILFPEGNSLHEKNEFIHNIWRNFSFSLHNESTGESENVKYIDFENPENNRFVAISQYTLRIPGQQKIIVPDIVLFINGLPVGLVECKSSKIANPITDAVTQMERYRNLVSEGEGVESLFWYNQILIATHGSKAVYSSITGKQDHFIEWKDSYPESITQFKNIKRQNILIHGMLRKENLLSLIENFIFWHEVNGRKIKVVPRYQQFRTVDKILKRLESEKSPEEKGGVVFHTQGSWKSLTMMMIVRAMYRKRTLQDYKIVFLTDRRDLDKQLGETAKAIGYTIKKSNSVSKFKEHLASSSSGIVFGMIQKFQERELSGVFPVLNTSKKILILIDEAHRSQYSMLGANMRHALPGAIHIAFTGTPLLEEERTKKTFGEFIDTYGMKDAVDDGVTLDIVYEGRTHQSDIIDKEIMDSKFEDVFDGVSMEKKKDIVSRYGGIRAYLESEKVIAEKAKDMIEHFTGEVLPNGFKAQVVANSQRAAVKYKTFLELAIKEKIPNITDPLVRGRLERLKVGVIISWYEQTAGEEKIDVKELEKYSNESEQDKLISSFKLGFEQEDENWMDGNVGILVVKSMLLTWFDAPIEQVMYLDTVIREHNLLQAIARVNRTYENKNVWFIVDYVGVANHLREALSSYSPEDIWEIKKVFTSFDQDIEQLIHVHANLLNFWKNSGVDYEDKDEAVWYLADEEVRMEFMDFYRKFTRTLDRVLPHPKALEFENDLRYFSNIAAEARNTYRDESINLSEASYKIQKIVNEHLLSQGIDPKIPPVQIFSDDFLWERQIKSSEKLESKRLESAVREYITHHKDEDPELFIRLSEKFEKILSEYKENWEQLRIRLQAFIEEVHKGRIGEPTYGFEKVAELPFFHFFVSQVYPGIKVPDLTVEKQNEIIEVTRDILSHVITEIQTVDFWKSQHKQDNLRAYLIREYFILRFRWNPHVKDNKEKIIHEIMQLAKALHHQLVTHE